MSDLISRSKVISVLEQLEEHSLTGKMDISNAIYLLNNQPTAYDIDKVVEELRHQMKRPCNEEDCVNDDDCCENKAFINAIKIVKQGCVSDDVCEWKTNDNQHMFAMWETECGNQTMIQKLPSYKYCPYCGKKIKAVE